MSYKDQFQANKEKIIARQEEEKQKYQVIDEALAKAKNELQAIPSNEGEKNYDVDSYLAGKDQEQRRAKLISLTHEIEADRKQLLEKYSYKFVSDIKSMYYGALSGFAHNIGEETEEKLKKIAVEIVEVIREAESEISGAYKELEKLGVGMDKYVAMPEKISFRTIDHQEESNFRTSHGSGLIDRVLVKELHRQINF